MNEAERLHRIHCTRDGCSEYGGHGGGKVSTVRTAARGTSLDPGSIPGRSTTGAGEQDSPAGSGAPSASTNLTDSIEAWLHGREHA